MEVPEITSRTRQRNTQVCVVTSSVHPGRACTKCILCKQGNIKYSHPNSWSDKSLLEQLKAYEPTVSIMADSCICRLCRDDVTNSKSDQFVPRWRKNRSPEHVNKHCEIPACTDAIHRVTKLANKTLIYEYFGVQVSSTSESTSESSCEEETALCLSHYSDFYHHKNPDKFKQCVTCGKHLVDTTKIRTCPDAKIVQEFLQENSEFQTEIRNGDTVCYTCYKEHLVIIKHKRSATTSSDENLTTLLKQIKAEMGTMSGIQTEEQALTFAAQSSALEVGRALLDQTAVLLPEVYEGFRCSLEVITKQSAVKVTVPSPQWLLSQLTTSLEHHMVYRCAVKWYGTLLYRRGGDLVHALSIALGQRRHKKQTPEDRYTPESCQLRVKETCEMINEKIHTSIKNLVEKDSLRPHRIEKLDIDNYIEEIDPDIWTAVCTLTQPLSSRAKNRENQSIVRRFFCVCILFFTTSSQCSFPIHTFLTDAIEACGGSLKLVQILNRLGVCASSDTHKRYVLCRVKERVKAGPLNGFPYNALTHVSIDNFDYRFTFARVFCGQQETSWHGTTIQFVQPQPKTLLYASEVNELSSNESSTNQYSREQNSPFENPDLPPSLATKRSHSILTPSNSPSSHTPLPKKIRRKRTEMEGRDTSTAVGTHKQLDKVNEQIVPHQHTLLQLQNFQITPDENKLTSDTISMFTHYMLQKVAKNEQSCAVIDLKSYITLINNLSPPEPSNVIHYKVMNQRCDDKATLLSAINDLYDEFIATKRMKWLLLEGDQATYVRVQSIKQEYGNGLEWLWPFPGDWHFLKNFQEVLLKDAGLCDLAKASGYQPKSIGTVFKRTHYFLLEVWESFYRYFLSIYVSEKMPKEFQEFILKWVNSFPTSKDQKSTHRNLIQMLEEIAEKEQYF